MNIIILHGDNTVASYERLQKFIDVAQSRGWDIERLEKEKNLSEILVSQNLFKKERLVLVEDYKLFTEKDLKLLNKESFGNQTTLIIYSEAKIPQTFIKSLPKPEKIEEFKLPKLIWKFLDSFYPGNIKNILLLLHEEVKTEPIEFIFALLARLLRDLYWVKIDSSALPYPSWRIGKLKNQASKFTNHQLTNLISDLANADIKSKTSQAELLDELDFIIATRLE